MVRERLASIWISTFRLWRDSYSGGLNYSKNAWR